MRNFLVIADKVFPMQTGSGAMRATIPNWAESLNLAATASGGGKLYKESAWAHRCVSIRMDSLSQIPWAVQDGQDDDSERLERDHPFVIMLRNVNREQNWIDLIRTTEADLLIYGQAFWHKVGARQGGGTTALQRINPNTVKVVAGKEGITGFVQKIEGRSASFERDEVVYFREYDPDNDLSAGVAKIEVARPYIETEIATEKFANAFFANHALPAFIVSFESDIPAAELTRLQKVWKRYFGGVDNQHKTAFLGHKATVTPLTAPLKDLALETVKQEARRSICAILGVPPAIAGAWEAANYAASDEQRQSLYQETVIPRAEYIASTINAELVEPILGDSFEFVWLFDELPILREDTNAKGQMLAGLLNAGAITAEAVVAEMGWPEEYAKEAPDPADSFAGPPTPGVTPPQLAPFAAQAQQASEPEPEQNGRRARPSTMHLEPDDVHNALRSWRRKTLGRLKRGESANFPSGYDDPMIPPALVEAVEGQLEGVDDPEEVKRVFQSALAFGGGA